MRLRFAFAFVLSGASSLAGAQAAPSATTGPGKLQYALRYSENATMTDTLGTWHMITTSGSFEYANGRARRPFALEYAGGYTSTVSGPNYATGAFHHLQFTQGLNWRKWMFQFGDDAGYRPQAPTIGFSGIPGTGEPIGGGTTAGLNELILTVNTHALTNDASGELQRVIGRGSTISLNILHDMLRFPDGNGLDTDQLMIGGGSSMRLNARNSLSAQYAFSRFTYPDYGVDVRANTLTFGFERNWNRAFHSVASAGPEWVRSSMGIPSSTGVAGKAALRYQERGFSATVSYDRGTSGGSGYLMGAHSDSVIGGLSRQLTRNFVCEISGGYRRSAYLGNNGEITAEIGGAQASYRIGRRLNAFANYTATTQSSSTQLTSNVLTQLMQSVSVGVSFSKDVNSAK